ncbi:MAG: Plasmid stabilization system protein [Mucilaginibacter sp.]|nr:Plasmid stabilization system protein [Mucilaginibacter sp.]
MEYDLRFHPKAEIEYLEAFVWYEEQLDKLGERFESSVERKLQNIISNPLFYPNKKFKCRECKIEDFPYLLVYKVYPERNLIFIVSVFHTSRKPGKKYRK